MPAAYPFATFHPDSAATPQDGRKLERATNGTLKTRLLWPADKMRFELAHQLTPVQRATMVSFYATNRAGDVDLTWWDGVVYTCRFASPPQYAWRPGDWWELRIALEQV